LIAVSLTIIVPINFAIASPCSDYCKEVIKTADEYIVILENVNIKITKKNQILEKKIHILMEENITLEEKNESWLNNPWMTIPLGMALGIIAKEL